MPNWADSTSEGRSMICPLLALTVDSYQYAECLRDRCAWWVDHSGSKDYPKPPSVCSVREMVKKIAEVSVSVSSIGY